MKTLINKKMSFYRRTSIQKVEDANGRMYGQSQEELCRAVSDQYERINKLTDTVNDIIDRLGLQSDDFPSTNDLAVLKCKNRLKELMKDIVRANERERNYVVCKLPSTAPLSERIRPVEKQFLYEKGYSVLENIDESGNYEMKVLWNSE